LSPLGGGVLLADYQTSVAVLRLRVLPFTVAIETGDHMNKPMKVTPLRIAAPGTIVFCALLALAATAAEQSATAPATVTYQAGKEIGRLANPAIIESSGVAASRIKEGGRDQKILPRSGGRV
jgi:hypothetical protein